MTVESCHWEDQTQANVGQGRVICDTDLHVTGPSPIIGRTNTMFHVTCESMLIIIACRNYKLLEKTE